ncbi:phage integrase N-terminal SAM-like domain-containing protein [uncultured Clostridium sp.]|uniref:phage integrase N-terminal SAM-like domain-containing protein n=1 Tax=uncultured Clostridium sp. TaxID=59620 RepID=UPI0026341261|nr:phage integrase N-terminal SAM-like domain-containing protein [uncultured Clostridium sp.]
MEECSSKSIKYYKSTIKNMLSKINKSIKDIKTEDLSRYLADFAKQIDKLIYIRIKYM